MSTKLTKAPFTERGALMDYVGYGATPEWRDNTPFRATLTVEGIERGRSAARFIWKDSEARTFPMFMTDMVALLKATPNVDRGTVDGWWMVQKRGQNYGIRPATETELAARA
ncbi:hypothetical protein [Streptomyces albidoflavus]|uniref:hypothetical protein n=1 Tax=Streptomyces albidoflavus TaxID=1886 RepID=UPI0033FEE552